MGWRCGDGIPNAACGEQCDPPGPGTPECNYQCQLGPAPALGTRHFSFGGSSYSSALGTSVNGEPIKVHELKSGDVIAVGSLKIKFGQTANPVELAIR